MLSLIAVGDIAAGDCTIDGIGIKSLTNRYGANIFFKHWISLFRNTDVVIGNLEGPLSEKSRELDLRLCGSPEFAKELKKSGFNVLSVANNHMMDHGKEIFDETIQLLQEQKIQIAGLRDKSGAYHCKPVVIEKKGIRIGILAYNWIGLPESPLQKKEIACIEDSVVNYTWNRSPENDAIARASVAEKNMLVHSDIKKLKDSVDVVILLPHWGIEWTHDPPYGVILEARSFVDSGADIILGGHPHVIQGIEMYKGKTIAYSLGNFIFDTYAGVAKDGICFSASINQKQMNFEIIPFRQGENYIPTPATDKQKLNIQKKMDDSTRKILADDAEVILNDDKIYKYYESQYNKFKIRKSLLLFVLAIRHPKLIIPLGKKILNIFNLIYLRLRGQKIRW